MCKCFVSEITESPRDGSQKILNVHCLPAKECIFESNKIIYREHEEQRLSPVTFSV